MPNPGEASPHLCPATRSLTTQTHTHTHTHTDADRVTLARYDP